MAGDSITSSPGRSISACVKPGSPRSDQRRLLLALSDDVVQQILRIASNPREPARTPGVLPRQAEKIQTFDVGHAALVFGIAALIENRRIDPAEIGSETHAPDPRRDLAVVQIERAHALLGLPRRNIRRFERRCDALFLDVAVDAGF